MPPAFSSRPAARWWSLTFLAAGLGMIILDGTIVAIALPSIMRDLSLTLPQAEWVNALYAVVFAALLLTAGRLADHWGRRALFLLGVAIFTATSVLAALAPTAGLLIAARGLQGVGAALVLPSSLATLSATFTGRERAAAFGIWGAITAGAAAIGPVLGGWLTATWGWPLIFWVNVPLGALVLLGVRLTTPETRGPRTVGFDYLGFALSAWAVASLIFSLIEGPTLGWFTPRPAASTRGALADLPLSPIPLLLASSALAGAAFLVRQHRQARRGAPVILDLTLFRLPTFTWGNATAALVAVGQFALVFVLPLFLLAVRGLDPLATGLTVAAMAGGAFASGIFARHLAARLGAARVVVGGLALEVGAVAGLALTLRAAPLWTLPAFLAAYGLGLGLASAQLTSTTLVDVPSANAGQGSATQSTVRQIGSALGTVLAGATLSLGLATYVPPPPTSVTTAAAVVIPADLQTTAGIELPQLREAAARGELGPDGPQWVAALTSATARAATLTLGVTLAFLTLGLASALQLARRSRPHSTTEHGLSSARARR
ncbi:MFS transporter [Buchananella hordeovulneris]|uniref:MFS transporter n=1 Tax=Buchananella hordeovulneris TaxID=52770 RepID=UPI000F5DF3E4|nr:MFS transporter [Buchananella hordeovulneris]RRD42887.1 MFS transporter [Buchananella hordeovulneris]RRD51571.1 MFS transporter [Buchananella hordeovulneris]